MAQFSFALFAAYEKCGSVERVANQLDLPVPLPPSGWKRHGLCLIPSF
jgi:hypothetical protein